MDFSVTGSSYTFSKPPTTHKGIGGSTSSIASKKRSVPSAVSKTGIFAATKHVQPTLFGKYYDRGDIPVKVSFHGATRKADWLVQNIELLDYHHYLPLFFEGIRQTRDPYAFLADKGLDDLLAHGQKRILPVLPQLILPIKKGLNTKNGDVICKMLKKLQQLVQCGDFIAQSLVPYYRQILPVFNLLKNKRINTGDKIDYGQRKQRDIGQMIQDTLELFQKHGGQDAYINIKYMIPTYESCMF